MYVRILNDIGCPLILAWSAATYHINRAKILDTLYFYKPQNSVCSLHRRNQHNICTMYKQSTLIIFHIFKIAFKIDVTLKTELHAGLPIEVLQSFILAFMIRGVSTILLGFSSDPFQKQ